MKILAVLFFCLSISFSSFSQSMYGYLGKRFYAKAALSTSPALVHRNTDGVWGGFRFNLIGTISANIVLDKKRVFAINYKRYSGVATINSNGFGLIASADIGGSSNSLGSYRFSSNEFGLNLQFFKPDLDAPLGAYFSFGFGMVYSKYNLPFQVLSNNSGEYGGYSYNPPTLLSFDNTIAIKSPILRFTIGKQTVFWDRLMFDYGIEFGLNLGNFKYRTRLRSVDYESGITQAQFNDAAKRAVQNRVYMMNLVNFKMGISYLIF